MTTECKQKYLRTFIIIVNKLINKFQCVGLNIDQYKDEVKDFINWQNMCEVYMYVYCLYIHVYIKYNKPNKNQKNIDCCT